MFVILRVCTIVSRVYIYKGYDTAAYNDDKVRFR